MRARPFARSPREGRARAASPAALALVGLALASCVSISTGSGDAGTSTTVTTTTTADGAVAYVLVVTGTATGIDCITTTGAGATLCASTSACPGITIDRDVYPDCGFRISGETLDIECDCSGSLCPLGVPGSCAEAASLLSGSVSETNVCVEVADGRCTDPVAPAPSSTSTTGTGSTCDPNCRDTCNGNPGCYTLCGC